MTNKPVVGVDYIGVSAGAVIVNAEGKYFMAKRSPGARDDHGTWEFPGGSVNLHESRETAAKRNIHDKYGLSIRINGTLGVYDVVDKDAGDHWLSTTFRCTHISGEPEIKQPEKCSEIGWFALGEIESLDLSRITRLNLADLRKERQ